MRLKDVLVACCILVALLLNNSNGDSWAPPMTRLGHSDSGQISVLIIPATSDCPCRLMVYRENNPDIQAIRDALWGTKAGWEKYLNPEIEKWQQSSERKLLWQAELDKCVAPNYIDVSEDGKYIVKLDNWYSIGHGDNVVAFYNEEGLIKKYSLEEVVPLDSERVKRLIRNSQTKIQIAFDEENEFFFKEAKDYSSLSNINPYEGLFDHTTSSRHWRKNGVEVMLPLNGKVFFGVWLSWLCDWVIWDMANGNIIQATPELLQALNCQARKQVRKNMEWDEVGAACHFLTYFRVAEDRQFIQDLLQYNKFVVSFGEDYIHSYSEERRYADMALSIWDGERQRFIDTNSYKCRYLGGFEGAVVSDSLPQSNLIFYLYLVPADISENQWTQQSTLHKMIFDTTDDRFKDCSEIPLKMSDITPGRYYIKCILDRNSLKNPNQYRLYSRDYFGQKGDLTNSELTIVDIVPGEQCEDVRIVCNTPIE